MRLAFWRQAKVAVARPRPIVGRSFAAAQTDRLLAGWRWDGGFSAKEIATQLPTIRSRSREMAKNNPHFRRWLMLMATNVVGEGFAFKSTPHDGFPGSKDYRLDEAAARFIEWHFWRWCSTPAFCDSEGRKTAAEIDRLCAKTWARDGEYFLLPIPSDNPYGMSLRVIRPDACDHSYSQRLSSDREVRCGVEYDTATSRPVAYYMLTSMDVPDVYWGSMKLARIPASQVIHGYTQEDPEQPRGIPLGHAAMTKLKMLEEYDKAELTAAREEACSVRTYYAPKGDEDAIADLTSSENSDAANALTAEKEPGQSEILPLGWKNEIMTPQHPNREVTAFKTSMLKDVSAGLNVEYSTWANDWSGVSYSSVRSGTIAERDMWTVLQDQMVAQSKSPVFRLWLKSFLSLPVSGGYPVEKYEKFVEHEFRGRRWMWVDPVRDMNAAETAVRNGWKTNAQVSADMGTDFDDNIEQLERERGKMSAGERA